MKPKFTALTAFCLMALMFATWFTVGCSMGFQAEKGTGAVVIQKELSHATYQLLRSNGDLIVMDIDSRGAPSLSVGDSFSNIVYVDLNAYSRGFVKGEGFKPAPPPPTEEELDAKAADEAIHPPNNGDGWFTCCNCITTSSGTVIQ